MSYRKVAMLAIALCASGPLGAQPVASDPAERRKAMERFAYMLGEWSGDASMALGPGRTQEVRQSERVRFAVGGQVLVIEGIGRTLANGVAGDTAFQAFGLLDWRPDRGYQLRAMTHEGREGTFAVTPLTEGQGFTWGFEVPGGRSRFTVRFTPEGEWHERGEFSRDGQQWFPTMEMRLRRVASGTR